MSDKLQFVVGVEKNEPQIHTDGYGSEKRMEWITTETAIACQCYLCSSVALPAHVLDKLKLVGHRRTSPDMVRH